ncbi:MAG: creatininase family protein [Desulfurococcales archaeon]|nr:creatininase family protein [Desulfurococcales archaeon]
MTKRFWELTGKNIDEADLSIMFLPVGSIERHGFHLPLGTDTLAPLFIAEKTAEKVGGLVLPPIWYGSCMAMRGHRGTFDISQEALSKYVGEILREAWRNGARLVVIVNGHGGNTPALHYTAREVSGNTGLAVIVVDWWRDVAVETRRSLFQKPGHAGEDETSAILAIAGHLVDIDTADRADVEYPPVRIYNRELEERIYSKALTGDARLASEEKGLEWLKAVIDELAEKVLEAARILGIK